MIVLFISRAKLLLSRECEKGINVLALAVFLTLQFS